MAETLLVEDQRSIRVITLNRPDVLNALNSQMRAELAKTLIAANVDESVKAVVLTGAGDRAFAAGQDLREAIGFTPDLAGPWVDEFFQVFLALRALDKPSIAALNGAAVGAGFQIALLADLRIAADHARMGMPEINDGLPCITGTWTLWPLIGRGRTVELVLTGRLLNTSEAMAWGLVNRVVPADQLKATALSWAEELAAKPRAAIRLNKERWRQLDRLAEDTKMFAQDAHAACFATGEPRRAMEAFLNRRRPTT